MLRIVPVCAFLLAALPTMADETPLDCKALFESLKAETPGDTSACDDIPIEYDLKTCTAPANYAAQRPASHVVLVLDGSGSMAGALGTETKMAAAKREAVDFLNIIEDDVPVGLIIYGHRGDNTEVGKPESCVSHEWLHDLGSDRGALADSIDALAPTGWTPLGRVLGYVESELAGVAEGEGDSVPVVYLVSDGEETCGGDPVAAARSLHQSGARAVVNVVGFDVDDKARAQLEAISDAGGGKYFPAEDSRALRDQLSAAGKTERAWSEYHGCIVNNAERVRLEYLKAEGEFGRCFLKESYTKRNAVITKRMQAYSRSDAPEAVCYPEISDLAAADYEAAQADEAAAISTLKRAEAAAVADANAQSVFNALPARE